MDSFFQNPPLWLHLVLFIVGAAVITKGASWFTDGAVGIAAATGVPKMVVGATIVSIATTMPEFSVSGIAAIMDRMDTSFGNAVGSTICNIGVILSLAALIQPVVIPKQMAKTQGVGMLASGALLFALGWTGTVGGWKGWVLLAATGSFLFYQARRSGWGNGNPNSGESSHDWWRIGQHFILGGICVVGGSVLVVQNAAQLARSFGVPELMIALTLVALGTSLPECITAITSSLKGHGEIAVGNVMGANVLNLTWVLGGAAVIRPMAISAQSYALDFPVMAFFMTACYFLAVWHGKIGRLAGSLFLLAYGIYLYLMFSFFA